MVAVVVAEVVAEAEVLVQPAAAAAAATVLLPRRALVSPNLRTSSPASSRYYSTARRLHSCSPWLTFPVKLSVTSFVLPVVPEGGVVFAVTPPILSVTERRRLNRRLWPLQKPRRDRRRGFFSRVQVVVSASRPSISSSRRASFAVPVSRLDEDDDDEDDDDRAPEAAPTRIVLFPLCSLSL